MTRSGRSDPPRWRSRPGAATPRPARRRLRRSIPSSVAMASAATPWLVWGCMARRCALPLSRKGERDFERVGAVGGHHLGAAGDDHVLHAGHDRRGGEVDRGDARAAEAVEGDAAGGDVVAGIERGHAAEVAALRPGLIRGAPDDVVHVGGVEAGPLGQRPQDGGAQDLGVQLGQGALAHLADAPRGPAGVDDPGLSHVVSSFLAALCGVVRFATSQAEAFIKSIPQLDGRIESVHPYPDQGG